MWAQQIPFARPLRDARFAHAGEGDPPSGGEPPDHTVANTVLPPSGSPPPTTLDSEPSRDNETSGEFSSHLSQRILDELKEIKSRQQQALHDLQRVAIEIAMHAARQLLAQRIANGEQDMQSLVRQAIASFEPRANLQIHLNPDDLQSISHAHPELVGDTTVLLLEDAQLERGNCFVESAEFDLVLDWQARLDEMRQNLLQRIGDARTQR